jgi:hypothetical protein
MKKLLFILFIAGFASVKCDSTAADKCDTPAYAPGEEAASNSAANMDKVESDKKAFVKKSIAELKGKALKALEAEEAAEEKLMRVQPKAAVLVNECE